MQLSVEPKRLRKVLNTLLCIPRQQIRLCQRVVPLGLASSAAVAATDKYTDISYHLFFSKLRCGSAFDAVRARHLQRILHDPSKQCTDTLCFRSAFQNSCEHRQSRHIADYLLHTYYRHYKLYLYAFSAREVANVKTVQLATQHAVPPPTFPSLMRAVPLAQWEAAQEEQRKAEEEAAAKIAEERAAALAEEQRLAQLAGNPTMSQGLRQQLDVIRTTVAKSSKDKLDDLEAKLTALEARMADSNKPLSAGAKGPVKPGKK